MELSGILIVDKPAGPTSFDVVHRVRAALHVAKVGHTGTLDPAATGVLPICLGAATKIAGYLIEGDKEYEATIRLGESTDTQDATGTVLEKREVVELTPARLEVALAQFNGEISQIPPMYSAVKKDGKRLYELARAGKEVEREPRKVTVHALELLELAPPELRVRVACSQGTPVRTLAHDLGQVLGCGGHLKILRRTRSGAFGIAQALGLGELLERPERAAERLIPLAEVFGELPALNLDARGLAKVAHGQPLELGGLTDLVEGARVRVLGPEGAMVALCERRGPQLAYLRVLAA